MQERTNTILKVMKAIGIPDHDCSPHYFWNELCISVAILTNPQILSYSERSSRSCVDEPQSNSQFLTVVTQMQHLFSFFHIMKEQVLYKAHTHHARALTISAVLHGWYSLSTTFIVRTSLLTSIWVWPSSFFTPLCFFCCSTFSQRFLLSAAA